MKYELYLIRQYWRNNKKQVAIIIGAIVLLVFSTMVNLLSARAENRRNYYEALHEEGAMDGGFYNVTQDEIDELQSSDVVDEVGVTTIVGSLEKDGESITLGYFNDDTACKLLSYGLEEGRFPKKEGEIAIEESTLHQMNLPGEVGENITVSVVTPDGTSVEKEYTLVGVIQDYSDITDRKNNELFDRDTNTPWPYPEPLAIISSAEGESYSAEYCNVSITYVGGDVGENHFEELDDSLQESLTPKNVWYYGRPMVLVQWADLLTSYDGQDLDLGGSMSKDRTTRWMLLLSLMTALITMISIFSIVSTYLEQRKNSYRILRVCGMKKSRIRRMMIMEIILFLLIGYIIGVLSGLIAHKIIMVIQYRYFGLEYLPGYSAEKIIQFHTYSPYLFALLFALLSFAAVAIKEMRAGKQKKKAGKKRVANPLNRVLNFYDQRRIKIVSVVLVLVSLSFGYAYLAASIEHDEGEYSDLFQLADSSMTDIRDSGFDYIIYRNKETDNKSGVNINVDTGVEQEVVDTLSRRDDVEDVQAVITDLTTELLIDRTVETEELRESIQDADYEHQTQGSAEEWGYDFDENWYQYYERYYEEFGLEEDVSHYSMPVVACTDDMLDLLEQYLVSGTIDREGILNGSAVLIVKNGESYLTNPFEVGDTMNLMDRVIKEESDIGQESEDESYVPQTPIYASPVVCGVLEITDDNLNDLLEAYDAPSYDVNIAANVLTTRSGYLSWGFPQSNYNKVCVKATEDADSAALDKAVNELITSKQGVTYVSLYTQLKKMQQKITSNVVSYVFTLILLLLIFLIGYGNILSMQYVASRKRNALLNGMGYSNRQTRRNFELSNLKYLGIASLISLVAILGIQGFLKLVVQFQVFILGYDNMEYSDRMKIYDKLDEVFMLGYRIHSQNVIPVMIMLVAVVCLISWIVMRLLFSGRSETVYHEVEENAF